MIKNLNRSYADAPEGLGDHLETASKVLKKLSEQVAQSNPPHLSAQALLQQFSTIMAHLLRSQGVHSENLNRIPSWFAWTMRNYGDSTAEKLSNVASEVQYRHPAYDHYSSLP